MIYYFGDFECDETRHELRQAGYVVPIEPKVFEVLRYFLEHPDRVVTKDELLDHCWSDTFVTEAALTRCLTKLRKVVHRDPTVPPVIKTVPRQGYRFIAALTTRALEPALQGGDIELAQDTPSSPASVAEPLSDQLALEPTVSAESSPPVAERRQLTVLFCDVVRSTALAEQLDPEDLHEVLQAYHAVCAEVIRRFDGYVAQYLGDGLLVYFGYPQAYEDAARRAVHTGLGIVRALTNLNSRLEHDHGVRVAVRLGIHTGLVVIGEVGTPGHVEQLAVGVTPNIASRLQGLAAPDTVVVSAETYHLVQGYFNCESMGLHTLTDVATPMAVYQVQEESGAQTRLEAVTARSLTPFVGREAELALLQERWVQVQQGMGHVMLVNGEAGIGKSRLVRALREFIVDVPYTRFECFCSPYHQHTLFYPLIDWIRRTLAADAELPEHDIQRLERFVQQCRLAMPESVSLLAPLLGLSLPADRYTPLQLLPQQQRQRILETLLAMVLTQAEQQPVLLIMEDVHWVDPSTLEWLGMLLDQGPTAPILTLMTCRPTFQSPWSSRAHITPLMLNRLSRPQVEQMMHLMMSAEMAPDELIEQVVTITDGVPLFVEEVTRLVTASEPRPQSRSETRPAVTIPATLHDSLMARLDHVDEAKRTAQLGATIGREFSYALLQAVSPLPEPYLQQDLGALVSSDLFYQRGIGSQTVYVFKHALIQEAAYTSLLRRTRQDYHHRIAQTLEEQFPEIAMSQPELVAHHYTHSATWAQAFFYLYKSGDKARLSYANQEATAFYTQAIEMSERMALAPDAARLLPIYEGRGLVWQLQTRFDEAIADFQMMRQLACTAGDTQQEGASLCHLAHCHFMKLSEEHIPFVEQYAQEALQLFEQTGDERVHAKGLESLGLVSQVRGELQEAEQKLEAAVQISRREGYTDTLAYSLMWLSTVAHFQGQFQRAIDLGEESLTLAREHYEGMTEFYALAFLCLTYWSVGAFGKAFSLLNEGMSKARERENAYIIGRLTNTLGWFHSEFSDFSHALEYDIASADIGRMSRIPNVEISALINIGYDHLGLGQLDRAQSYFESSLERVEREAFGAHRWRWKIRLWLGLAELCETIGDYEQALQYVDAGLQEALTTSSQKYVAKGWGMQGSLFMKLGDTESARRELQQAYSLADQLQSPTLIYPLAYKFGQWHETAGQEREAAAQYRKAQTIIESMARGLEDQALRTTFLQSIQVQAIEAGVARLDG